MNETQYKEVDGMYFHEQTSESVCRILVRANRDQKSRIRIFYGDVKTGEAWNEEYDVLGFIGKSTGSIQIPLMLKSSRSEGGPAVLDHCIVRIQCAVTKKILIENSNFHVPEMIIKPALDSKGAAEVWQKETCIARFSSQKKATHWVDFMNGRVI